MFSLPCTFSGLTLTADKGGALRFRSRAELTDAEVTAMKNAFQTEGVLVFADGPLSRDEVAELADKGPRDGKQRTASQELRGALYVAYRNNVAVLAGETWEHYYRRRVLTMKARVLEEIQEAEG